MRQTKRGRRGVRAARVFGIALLAVAVLVVTPVVLVREEVVPPEPVEKVEQIAEFASAVANLRDVPPTLAKGDQGPDVARLQRRLASLGYQVQRASGRYDGETAHAVTAFQKVQGLHPSGRATPATQRALEEPRRPRARDRGAGTHVEVDLHRQVLYLVRDGRVTAVHDASTGTGKPYRMPSGRQEVADTPTGRFTVQWRVDGVREAELGPMYRPVYFASYGIAIHGGQPVPPRRSSHGCVRVTNATMDALFDLLPVGTTVIVHD